MIAPQAPSPARSTLNYRVERTRAGWSVERDGASLGVFADPDEAVEQACRSARQDAARDHLAIVTAHTTPGEFHCFVPAQGAAPSPPITIDRRGAAWRANLR